MAEILLYGEVGWDFGAKWLQSALDDTEGDVTLRVHSPGGDVFEGVAISNVVRRARSQGRRVTAVVDGLAASAASYMCLTCDRVVASPGSVFMVHPPSGGCFGTADDMRRVAQALDTCHTTIANLYATRTGRDPRRIDEAMRDETWMTDAEAVEFGLADAIEGEAPDLSLVDERWSHVREDGALAAFAGDHPALAERMDEYRDHSRLFAERLERARELASPAVDNAGPTLPPTEDDRDAHVEATDAAEGEAPVAYAVLNGHIYRIGKTEE